MLAIARALLTNPQLLLMDEPSEGLSPLAVQHVVEVIEHLRAKAELPILLVEQNLSLALTFADYIYVMNKGTIVFDGPAEELRGHATSSARTSDSERAYVDVPSTQLSVEVLEVRGEDALSNDV